MNGTLTITMDEALTVARILNLAQLEGRCAEPAVESFLEKVEAKLDESENA